MEVLTVNINKSKNYMVHLQVLCQKHLGGRVVSAPYC